MAILSLNFWLWLSCRDYTSIASENAKHLVKAYEMYYKISDGLGWHIALNTITYPPLFYVPAVALFITVGSSSETLALASLWPFIVLAGISSYGISKKISLPNAEAITASLLTSTILGISLQEEGYLIEYAILSLVTIILYLVMASEYMSKRYYSLALGFICGIGMLTKWTIISYLPIAILICIIMVAKYANKRKQRLTNLILSALIFVLLANTWYGAVHINHNLGTRENNFQATFSHFRHSRSTEIEVRTKEVSLNSRAWYEWGPIALLILLVSEVVPFYLSPFIALGIGIACVKLKDASYPRANIMLVLFTLLFILIVFTFYPSQTLFSPSRTLRHLGPAIPLAIIFAMVGINNLPALIRQYALTIINVIACLATIGWTFPKETPLFANAFFRPRIYGTNVWSYGDPMGWLTAPKDNGMQAVIDEVDRAKKMGKTPLYCFSLEQDFQPLLVESYRNKPNVPVAVMRQGKIEFLDGKTQFTEPDTPTLNLDHPVYIMQSYRNIGAKLEDIRDNRAPHGHSIDRQTSDFIQTMLKKISAQSAEAKVLNVTTPTCVQEYYILSD